MIKCVDDKIEDLLNKLTQDEKKTLATHIARESNYYIANYLKAKTNARLEAIGEFTEYLMEGFDGLTPEARVREAMNFLSDYLTETEPKTHLKRIK